jgi:hypothetical protein
VGLLLLLTAAAAAASTTPAPAARAAPAEPGQTIVVTGRSLADTERELQACLARHCPPDEDIAATLAHAENLFVAGNYMEAWRATHASVARNGGKAKHYPVQVSDLYRADGRIALHLGERDPYVSATLAMRRALSTLPKDDVRLLVADVDVAAMYTAVRDLDSADRAYRDVEHRAEALGRRDIAGAARLRRASLQSLSGLDWLARKDLQRIADDRREMDAIRASARALAASLGRDGPAAASAAGAAASAVTVPGTPVLLYQPRIQLPEVPTMVAGSTLNLLATENFDRQWIDVGFRVTPDGKVDDLQILRSHGDTAWSRPLLQAIAGRLYSRTAKPQGSQRVERYTYTSFWSDVTGSRLRQRSPNARIEYLDLTAEAGKVGG